MYEINLQKINDGISNDFYETIKATWEGKVTEGFRKGFRSVRHIGGIGMNSDGVGTKTILGSKNGVVEGLGQDLVAMVCDDAIAMGGDPFMMTTTLDLADEYCLQDEDRIQLLRGLAIASSISGVPIIGGESAILGNDVLDDDFIWNATVVWRKVRDSVIDGTKIMPGDSIIAFREPGCRSNGFTKIRELIPNTSGRWEEKVNLAMIPSTIYTPLIRPILYSDAPISGMIHVTGGGVLGRLRAYLEPSGYGASIYDLYPPGELFQRFIDENRISKKNAYSTWSMGNGFFLITSDPKRVIAELEMNGHDPNGSIYRVVGQVTECEKILIDVPTILEA